VSSFAIAKFSIRKIRRLRCYLAFMKEIPRIVGVISDTHGLLRPEAKQALLGSDLIIHAGDVGNPAIMLN